MKTLVLLLIIGSVYAEFNLLLMHNNDMHARFEETSQTSGKCKNKSYCFGGFARVAHVVREARNAAKDGTGPSVLYLNAGDTYTGTPWFSVHKWKIAVDFLNTLAPDAMSFGNHEFDFGIKGILPFLRNYKHPLVAANFDYSKEPLFTAEVNKSVVLNVNGHKIGVIGYITPETRVISDVGYIEFLDEVESIKKESERLDAEGVKIIIALGHSGFEVDKSIAKNVPLVDVVIGGHTNTFLWNGKQPDIEVPEDIYPTVMIQKSGKKVPVVQAYAYTKYMGKLYTTFDDEGELIQFQGKPQLLNHLIPQERDMLDLLETYREPVDALSKKTVGRTRVSLDSSTCRKKECNFGNLITDAMVAQKAFQYGGYYWTDTPIAVMNGGSIRTTIDIGSITVEDIIAAQPFDLQYISFNLTGSDLKKMLETSARSNGETSRGEFLQVSGLQVTYDLEKPVGSRVEDVKVRCGQCKIPQYEDLDLKKIYRILGNSYILNAGDGYDILRDKAFGKKIEDLGDKDTTVWYLEKEQFVYPDETGRITVLKQVKGNSSSRISILSVWTYLVVACLSAWHKLH